MRLQTIGSAVLLLFLSGISLQATAAPIAVPVSSTFESDTDGWTGDNVGEFFFDAVGGNPGGFLYFDDIAPSGGLAVAPAKFLGDWSALDGVGVILYDHRVFDSGSHTAVSNRSILISGPGGDAKWTGSLPCEGQNCSTAWETFVVPLEESSIPAPAFDAYYLVAPRGDLSEGSHGLRGDTSERPRGPVSCQVQSLGSCP